MGLPVKMTRLSELSDLLGFMVLACPDRFAKAGAYGDDKAANLDIAFGRLKTGLTLLDKRLTPEARRDVEVLIERAYEANRLGNRKTGAHLLQDVEDIAFQRRYEEYAARKVEPT